jgi:hypothetical protein
MADISVTGSLGDLLDLDLHTTITGTVGDILDGVVGDLHTALGPVFIDISPGPETAASSTETSGAPIEFDDQTLVTLLDGLLH